MLWIVWLFSLFFNQIILLNFLIADIGASYTERMEKKMFIWYRNKLKITSEVDGLLNFFKVKKDNTQKEKVIMLQLFYKKESN